MSTLEALHSRQQTIIDMFNDISDKGCGICRHGIVMDDLMVRCNFDDEPRWPHMECSKFQKCLRIYVIQYDQNKHIK